MDERKQTPEILKPFATARCDMAYPFPRSGLMFNIRVCRVNGENALSSCDAVRSSLVTVVQVDTKDLCEAMADLGGCSHVVAVEILLVKSVG